MRKTLVAAGAIALGVLPTTLTLAQNQDPGTLALRSINANVTHLPAEAEFAVPVVVDAEAFSTGRVLFPLGANDVVRGEVTKTIHHTEDTTSWLGTVEGVDFGWFSFVQHKDAFHGVIGAGELGTFELYHSLQNDANGNSIYNLVKLDTTKFLPCAAEEVAEFGAASRMFQENQRLAMASQMAAGVTSQPGENPDPSFIVDDGSVIDVMIVYTAEVRQARGGTNNMIAFAQNCINTTNNAYSNSQIGPLVLNLVHTEEVNYNETGSASTDLTRLRNTSDGYMDNVHTLRDVHAADLVAMIVNDFNACGIGYLAPFSEDYGFTVTVDGCAVGNLSFPHEIGHNMGCAHDRDNAGGSTFNYAYGWRWNGNNGPLYRSVMSYSPGSRVPYFSNPDVNYQGVPTGRANSEDNARCHDETRSSVANFRDSNGCISFSINSEPESQTVCPGTDVVMSAFVTGNLDLLTFEWRKDGSLIPGADSNVLELLSVTSDDAGSYELTVIEPCGSETTDPATLTVEDALVITDQPDSQAVDEGVNVTFTVGTLGADTYQWFGPSGLLLFEESPTLTLNNVTQADAGEYYCFISGPCNTSGMNSDVATLTVNTDSDCVADVNGDGELTPSDFTAWVNAFNTGAPECDQNQDGMCSPTDFTAWVAHFNKGC